MDNKKQEEINRLNRLLYEKDKEHEKAKWNRAVITTLAFAAFYFWLLWRVDGLTSLLDVVGTIFAAIVIAGIHLVVNSIIFGQLSDKGRSEKEALERIKRQIRELEESTGD